jgi:transposase
VRHQTNFVRERVNLVNRIQKLLENANIKLACVASDVMGKSGPDMLERIVAGEEDAVLLADLARGVLPNKSEDLKRALTGRVKEHQRVIRGERLRQVDTLDASIARLEKQIEHYGAPFEEALRQAGTITGVSQRSAQAIISEIGTDMDRFPSDAHLTAWAGVAPGNNESAGKRFSGRVRQGNPALKRALTEAAWAASHTKGTYLAALFHRLAARRGKKRAIVAVARTILVAL